jgi:predicted metal-dependent enzyme (double-stranded beta helix superfamily)
MLHPWVPGAYCRGLESQLTESLGAARAAHFDASGTTCDYAALAASRERGRIAACLADLEAFDPKRVYIPAQTAFWLNVFNAVVLRDAQFVSSNLNPATRERQVLYEDPELGFCVLAHNYAGAKNSPPHDHGPSWAIYGQAKGETEMTDYELVAAPREGKPGKARALRTYKLTPGTAHLYNEGDLHSPRRTGPTQLIRIEGMNMDRIKRARFELA